MNQALTKTASTTVMGHFDGVENGMAVGWAFDTIRPGQRLHVEVLCEGEIVAFGTAHHFREDLIPAGVGDGKHLFLLPLSYELLDGHVHHLTARETSTGLPLHGGVVSFGPLARNNEINLISRKQGLALLEQMLQRPEFSAHAGKADTFAKLYRIGALAGETGRLDDARYAWSVLQKALGDNALCHCKLGEASLLEGKPAEALEEYRAAATAQFDLHWAHVGIAQALFASRRPFEAEDALRIAVGLQPEDAGLREKLHKLQSRNLPQRVNDLINQGARDTAVEVLKKAMIQQPECLIAHELLGQLLVTEPDEELASLPCIQQLQRLRKTLATLDALLDDFEQNEHGDAR